jgi:cell division transport system permease protein
MRPYLILHEAISNVGRHRLVSMAATITIALILMVFGLFLLIFSNLQGLGNSLREQAMMTVYLQDGLTNQEMRALQERISDRPEVKAARLTSKEEALRDFQRSLPGQSTILQSLGENPLPASIDIQLQTVGQSPEAMTSLGQELRLMKGVQEVQDSREWLTQFAAFTGFVRVAGIGIGLLLGIAVMTIIANTIKLSIYGRTEEIGLMRLIGAKEGFIRAPFFIEGAAVGFMGGVVALFLLGGIYVLFQQWLRLADGILRQALSLTFFSFETLFLILLLATFLGGIGGYFSVRNTVQTVHNSESLW